MIYKILNLVFFPVIFFTCGKIWSSEIANINTKGKKSVFTKNLICTWYNTKYFYISLQLNPRLILLDGYYFSIL